MLSSISYRNVSCSYYCSQCLWGDPGAERHIAEAQAACCGTGNRKELLHQRKKQTSRTQNSYPHTLWVSQRQSRQKLSSIVKRLLQSHLAVRVSDDAWSFDKPVKCCWGQWWSRGFKRDQNQSLKDLCLLPGGNLDCSIWCLKSGEKASS